MVQFLWAQILLVLSASGHHSAVLELRLDCAPNPEGVRMILRNLSSESRIIPDQLLPWSLSGDVVEWNWSESNLRTVPKPSLITELGETLLRPNEAIEVVVTFNGLALVSAEELTGLTGKVGWRIKSRAAQILRISGAGYLRFDNGVCFSSHRL